jgi:hypothetical protein
MKALMETRILAACSLLAAVAWDVSTSRAFASSQSTYVCFSDAKFQYGSGGIVEGTHAEGRFDFYGVDIAQEQKRNACIEANRQCNLILDRLKRGPERLSRPFRESDCVVTGERYERRHSGWQAIGSDRQQRGSDVPHWALIGQGDVDPSSSRHILRIHSDHDGRYSRIKIHVLRHDVQIGKVGIEYGNGTRESWDIGRIVKDEAGGPELDLKGRERHIRNIQVEYQAINPFSHSGIQIFGLTE